MEQKDVWRDMFATDTPADGAQLLNIRQNGVITAIRVRPRNGRYQIIAGHNRVEASKMVGLTTIPAIVEAMDDDQADSNLIATGKSGRGKSTTIKHLLMAQYMMGVRVMVIDPEREYRELCRNLGGVWVDAGGGVARSNPLQVRVVPEDDADEENPLYRSCVNAMAEHLHTLKVLLRFRIPSLTDNQLSLLEQSVTELYARFGITPESDFFSLAPEAYPIMSDWHDLLVEKTAKDVQYGDLATLLWPMARGADSALWNGHTNIDLNAPFVVIDTNRLMGISPEQQTAAYFNLLSLCWDNASRNQHEPIIIMADESHVLFDPALPEAGMYVRCGSD